MADLFERLVKNYGPIGQHRERAHGYFAFPKLEGEIGSRMRFRGKDVIVWSLNNYLGLANHPEVRKTDAEAAAKYGLATPMGARMMSGNTNFHEQLEKELAAFESKEDACLLNYGYQGMVSIIDALCSRHDVIVYDAESHACIIDGVRLHPGHRYVFKHNDIEDLEKQNFGSGVAVPSALLYMQLRRSLSLQLHKASALWLKKNSLDVDHTLRATNFHNIRPAGDLTKWEVMRATISEVAPEHPQRGKMVSEYLLGIGRNEEEAAYLTSMKKSLTTLAGLPTARLER